MPDDQNRGAISNAVDLYFSGLESGDVSDIPLAKDVVFEGPLDPEPIVGSDAVGQFVGRFAEAIASIEVRDKVIDGPTACATFRWTTKAGVEIEMCDYFRFAGAEIAYIRPYFDTRLLTGE